MRYTVTRQDGRAVVMEWEPGGYAVTAGGGVVTEVNTGRDVIGQAFDMAADAAREIELARRVREGKPCS